MKKNRLRIASHSDGNQRAIMIRHHIISYRSLVSLAAALVGIEGLEGFGITIKQE